VDAFLSVFGDDRFVLGLSADELAWYLPGDMEIGLMELVMRPDQIKETYLSKVAKANATINILFVRVSRVFSGALI